MEILQGNINRDDYYSIKECAEILGVTTKTIRNRIDNKRIIAVWYEVGKGQSQWLIPKEVVKSIVDSKQEKATHNISIPTNIIDEIKIQLQAQIQAENAQIRTELQEIKETQARIEKSLQERDMKLIQAIRDRQHEQQQTQKKPWWKVWA